MKKRITMLITTVLIVAQIITVFATVSSFRQTYQEDMFASLEGYIRAIGLNPAESKEDLQTIAEEYAEAFGQDVRISFLDDTGDVIADTEIDTRSEENHSDRPEIIEAGESVFGRDVRESASTHKKTLYSAKKVNDHLVLRMAMPIERTQDFVKQATPAIVITFIILTVLGFIGANFIARGVLAPMTQLYRSIKDYSEGKTASFEMESEYEELDDISWAFGELSGQLNRYIDRAKLENKKSSLILDNIQEGLMVLDENKDVMLINSAARKILGADRSSENINILHYTRRPEIIKQIDKAFKKRKNFSFDVVNPLNDRTYRYHLSTVSQEAFKVDGEGLLILISDVTDIVMAERVRRDFAANVSHELKTPLTSIDGYAQLLANGMVEDEEEIERYAQRITEEADRLMGLLNDTLALSELEQISIEEKSELIEIEDVAVDVREMLKQPLEDKDVALRISGQADVVANRGRIKQLLLNLCENAVKYNKQNGRVDVMLSQDEEFSYIVVKDNGIGIPKSEQSRVFERFYRARNAGGATQPGTGLGLAIAKHITHLYDGSLVVKSKLGNGSTFIAKLKR